MCPRCGWLLWVSMVEECYYHGFNYGGLTKTLIGGGKSKVFKKEN